MLNRLNSLRKGRNDSSISSSQPSNTSSGQSSRLNSVQNLFHAGPSHNAAQAQQRLPTPSFLPDDEVILTEDVPAATETPDAVSSSEGSALFSVGQQTTGRPESVVGSSTSTHHSSHYGAPTASFLPMAQMDSDEASIKELLRSAQRSLTEVLSSQQVVNGKIAQSAAPTAANRPKLGRSISTRQAPPRNNPASTTYSSLGALADAIQENQRTAVSESPSGNQVKSVRKNSVSPSLSGSEQSTIIGPKDNSLGRDTTVSATRTGSVADDMIGTRRFKQRVRPGMENIVNMETSNRLAQTKDMLENMYKRKTSSASPKTAESIVPTEWMSIFSAFDDTPARQDAAAIVAGVDHVSTLAVNPVSGSGNISTDERTHSGQSNTNPNVISAASTASMTSTTPSIASATNPALSGQNGSATTPYQHLQHLHQGSPQPNSALNATSKMPRPQTASSLVAMAAYPTNLNEDLPKQLVTSEGTEKESLPLRLYQNELEYVQALECVSTIYLNRINEERVLNVTEAKIIFANIEQLLFMHRELLLDLQKAIVFDRETDMLTHTVELFTKWTPFLRMYNHYAGARPISEAYLFSLLFLVNGQTKKEDPTAMNDPEISLADVDQSQERTEAEEGFEITLEALCYGKDVQGAKERGKNLTRLLRSVMAKDKMVSLNTLLNAPITRLQWYINFFEEYVLSESAKGEGALRSCQSLIQSLQQLHLQCFTRQQEVDATIRLMEWDWVIDFTPLESNWLDGIGISATSAGTTPNDMTRSVRVHADAVETFSLLKQPLGGKRTYCYHGFVDMSILGHNGFHPVLAILFSDILLMAQPLDLSSLSVQGRQATHRKNWIAHTIIHRSSLQAVNGVSIQESETDPDLTPHIELNLDVCTPSLVYASRLGNLRNVPQMKWQFNIYPADDTYAEWTRQFTKWLDPAAAMATSAATADVATAANVIGGSAAHADGMGTSSVHGVPSDMTQSRFDSSKQQKNSLDTLGAHHLSQAGLPLDLSTAFARSTIALVSSRTSLQARQVHSWVPSVTSKRATCLIPLDPTNPFASRAPVQSLSGETPPDTHKKMSIFHNSVRDSQATFVQQRSDFDYSNRTSMAVGNLPARIRLTTTDHPDLHGAYMTSQSNSNHTGQGHSFYNRDGNSNVIHTYNTAASSAIKQYTLSSQALPAIATPAAPTNEVAMPSSPSTEQHVDSTIVGSSQLAHGKDELQSTTALAEQNGVHHDRNTLIVEGI